VAIRVFRWDRKKLLRFALAAVLGGAILWCGALPFGIAARQGRLLGAALQITPWNMAFAGLLAFFLLVGTSRWRSLVLVAPLCYLGNISYGLYLIHLLIFSGYDRLIDREWPELAKNLGHFSALTLRFFVVLSISIGIAHLSRWTFEEYFLRMKDRAQAGRTALERRLD
jgi:peptidoglycan/LPS O-acetylase OafA/YrhL